MRRSLILLAFSCVLLQTAASQAQTTGTTLPQSTSVPQTAQASQGQQVVSFQLKPTILLLVSEAGVAETLYSNLGHAPSASEAAGIYIRVSSRDGRDFPRADVSNLQSVLAQADWNRRGRIWTA